MPKKTPKTKQSSVIDENKLLWLAARQGDAESQFKLVRTYYKKSKGAAQSQEYQQAFELLRKTATEDNAKAQFLLGIAYSNPQGVPQDYAQAALWFTLAANQGHAASQFQLGAAYANGQGVSQNYRQAAFWFNLAANQGFALAQCSLGVAYHKGQGVVQNNAKAIALWLKAAIQGLAQAQFYLGIAYHKGQGVAQNDIQAVQWWEKAAKQGDMDAQYSLGIIYHKGQGIAKDDAQAAFWFKKAANQGHPGAQNNLGVAYQKGQGIKQDDLQAVSLYQQAANQGHTEAQFNLGLAYANGRGLPQNHIQAIKWFSKAAATQEDAETQFFLGVVYANSQEFSESVEWWRKAAEQEFTMAQIYLGFAYQTGQGVTQDNEESLYWFRRVAANLVAENESNKLYLLPKERFLSFLHQEAQKNVPTAQVILAHLYKTGSGVIQDKHKAFSWMLKAAQQKDLVAMYCLGVMYMDGLGISKNTSNAHEQFQKIVEILKQKDKLFAHFSDVKLSLDKTDETNEYQNDIKQWIGLLAQEKLRALQEKAEQQRLLKAKEEADKQMLSFLTHTLNNSLGTAPETVRQTIRLLSGEYEKNPALYKAINNILSLFATFSIVENLIQTFKQYIIEPEVFQQSWRQDNQGKGTIELVIAFALRQTLSRIFFQLSEKLEELFPSNQALHLKKLRHSFMNEVVILALNSQNAENVFAWLKQNINIFVFDLEQAKEIHFEENKTRFTFLFSILSELIYNALKYSNGKTPIEIVWGTEGQNYYFICRNTFNPDLRYREQGSRKGLVFIDKLMKMLNNSKIIHQEEENIFTVELIFSKTNF
jgi:uncharacterized protein